MTPELARLMAAYNRAMNLQIYESAAQLPAEELQADKGAFFGSILGTLNHLCVADTLWLKRFAQAPDGAATLSALAAYPSPTSLRQTIAPDLVGLRTYRVGLDALIAAWADALTQQRFDSPLTYTNTAGHRFTRELGALVQHFFNHQTHHRGQATTLLFQCGIDVGATDLIAMIPSVEDGPLEAVDARSDARTKTIDGAPDEVFAALRDADRVARWWGPDGFTSTFHHFQFQPGGRWHLTLHGPDGNDYPNEYRVLRIEQDRLLELDHPSDDHHFTLRIELLRQGEDTLVAWQQTFDTVDDYRPLADFLAQANEQVLERLSAEVRRLPRPREGV